MTLLEGSQKISTLSQQKRQEFEFFFQYQIDRLLSLIIDWFFLLIILLLMIDMVLNPLPANTKWLDYTHLALVTLLALAHRYTPLHTIRHLTVYLLFLLNAFFCYQVLNATGWANNADTFFKLSLFLLSVGWTTFSLLHSAMISLMHLILLVVSLKLSLPTEKAQALFITLMSNWFILFCLVHGVFFAPFKRYIFLNIFAFEFILQQKNRSLSDTLDMLHTTEQQLAFEQKHRALSHMASGLLHEIINPVNCTMQALNYAQDVNAGPEVDTKLMQVMARQRQITSVVTELRAFSIDRPHMRPQRVNLKNLIEQAIRLCHGELKAIGVRKNIPDGVDLNGHPNALTQLMVNLLLSASDALHDQITDPDALIQIDAEQTSEHVVINITNNRKNRSEPDDAIQNEPKTAHSALGMRVCHTIMRHHQGTLSLDSHPGSWTRASIQFPRESFSGQDAAI